MRQYFLLLLIVWSSFLLLSCSNDTKQPFYKRYQQIHQKGPKALDELVALLDEHGKNKQDSDAKRAEVFKGAVAEACSWSLQLGRKELARKWCVQMAKLLGASPRPAVDEFTYLPLLRKSASLLVEDGKFKLAERMMLYHDMLVRRMEDTGAFVGVKEKMFSDLVRGKIMEGLGADKGALYSFESAHRRALPIKEKEPLFFARATFELARIQKKLGMMDEAVASYGEVFRFMMNRIEDDVKSLGIRAGAEIALIRLSRKNIDGAMKRIEFLQKKCTNSPYDEIASACAYVWQVSATIYEAAGDADKASSATAIADAIEKKIDGRKKP